MHYPHLSRSNDAPPHASSSSSLSSAAPSDILPAAPPSNSSQSDIGTDLSSSLVVCGSPPSTFPGKGHRFFAKAISQRSTSMGQVLSSATVLSPSRPNSPPESGGRFKRAFGRRKKSEDLTATFANTPAKGKERDFSDPVHPGASTSDLSFTTAYSRTTNDSSSRTNRLPNALQAASNKLNVFGKPKVGGQLPKASTFSGAPPPPPPKEPAAPVMMPQALLRRPMRDDEAPLPPVPPETQRVTPPRPSSAAQENLKEDWRKSDATMTSRVTIRPGAQTGTRSPRPVSAAESSHSGHTVVPVNKRLSALITDAEFNVVEEGDHSDDDSDAHADDEGIRRVISRDGPKPRPGRSPSGSIKNRNRRSLSLNVGPGHCPGAIEPASALPSRSPTSLGYYGQNTSPSILGPSLAKAASRDNPTLTRTAANGYIAPLNTLGAQHSTGSNIRNRLVPWMSASAGNTPTQANPPRGLPNHVKQPNSGLRQTAVSMTGGLAPAAGLAMGLGKRAVERVGRAWGGLGSSNGPSSDASVISQSSSISSITSSEQGHPLGRIMSKDSGAALGGFVKRKRRFGGPSPSVSSVASSSATSEADAFVVTGPGLGRRLRGPKRTSSGASVIGGLVFKQRLQTCILETAIDGLDRAAEDGVGMKSLEQRMLPALVVRCAQHIFKYGVREEGLFRISGRSSHVAKLRSEFDTGADWDMSECDPSNLDPHAVASIFKTYLRELPESILTSSLIPYFESALSAEDQASRASTDSVDASVQSSGPSHQRSGSSLALRKAPSLSTLAVPSFAGKRTVSDPLLKALTWLITSLPRENRDLLYTVVELIRATAARSAETKMPLGNLLLLFSPTLNMNPALLRVLCEHDTIWEGVPQSPPEPETQKASTRVTEDDDDEAPDVRATFVTARESTGSMDDASGAPAQERLLSPGDDHETTEPGEKSSSPQTLEPSPKASAVDPTGAFESGLQVKSDSTQVTTELALLPPINPVSPVSFGDDSASFVSALEPSSSSTRSISPHMPQDVPPLSSSESLSSPSEVSEEPVSPHGGAYTGIDDIAHPDNVIGNVKPASRSRDSFFLAPSPSDPVNVSLHHVPRRPPSNADLPSTNTSVPNAPTPVPFPSTIGGSPVTPISRRKSFALLAFPILHSSPESSPTPSSSNSPSTTSTPPSTWHRPKRPSLHLLLQKVTGMRSPSTPVSRSQVAMASAPTLSVYSQNQNASASVPSLAASSPTVDAHTRTLTSVAPKLETAISSSPIRVDFGETASGREGSNDTSPSSAESDKIPVLNISVEEDSPSSSSSAESSRYVRARAGSYATSSYVTPTGTTPRTPIADLYSQYSRSKSAMSFFNADPDVTSWRATRDDKSLLAIGRTFSDASKISVTPSIDLSMEETQEDWAESILMAAKGSAE